MASNGNVKIVLDGEAEYNAAVKRINTNVKELNSELSLLSAKYGENANSAEALKAKQEILNKKLEEQKNKVAENARMLQEAKEKFGENSTQAQRFATSLNRAQIEVERLNAQLIATRAASSNLGQIGSGLTSAGSSISNFSGKLNGLSTAATMAGTALAGMVYKSAVYADDMNTLSKITSVSTEDLQKFAYASDLVDVSIDTYTSSLKKLTKNMSEAQSGAATQSEAFNKIGVAVTNSDGTLRNANDVYMDTIDALGAMKNETERDATAMDIFGKSATELNPLIEAGSAALRQYGQDAADAGAILSQDALDGLNEFNDKIDTLKAKVTGQLAGAGADFAGEMTPILEHAATAIENLVKKFTKLSDGQQGAVLKAILFTSTISKTTAVAGTVTTALGSVINKSSVFVSALKNGSTAMEAFNLVCEANPLGAVLTVVGLLAAGLTSLSIAEGLVGENASEIDKLNEKILGTKEAYDSAMEAAQKNVEEGENNALVAWKLTEELEKLQEKTNLTTAEQERMAAIVERLNELMPNLNLEIDSNTGNLNTNTDAIYENIAAYERQILAKKRAEEWEAAVKREDDAKKNYEEAQKQAEKQKSTAEVFTSTMGKGLRVVGSAILGQGAGAFGAVSATANEVRNDIDPSAVRNSRKELEEATEARNKAEKSLKDYTEATADASEVTKRSTAATREDSDATSKNASEKKNAENAENELSDVQKQHIKDVEYYHEIGKTSETMYIYQLSNIRDNYYTKDSDEWRNYNKKILNLQEKAHEEQQKEYEKHLKELEEKAKQARENELKLMKWNKSMGNTSEAQYYQQLANYRDKYFEENTDEWRQYTLELKQYKDKLAEEEQQRQEQLAEEEKQRQEQARQEQLSILKWRLDMGLIAEASYYKALEQYRDQYFDSDSAQWRQHTLEIANYQKEQAKKSYESAREASLDYINMHNDKQDWDKINDSAEAAYSRVAEKDKNAIAKGYITEDDYKNAVNDIDERKKQDFNNKLQFSQEWIDDRKFYDDWSKFGTTESESWQRIIDTIEDGYERGLLSYKDYISSIKSMTKSGYSAVKEENQKYYDNVGDYLDKLLSDRKTQIDSQIEALNSEISDLQAKQKTENRNKELSELQAEAKLFKNAGTMSGQAHYKELTEQIDKLNQEAELEELQKRNNEIIENLNNEYANLENEKKLILEQLLASLETSKDSLVALPEALTTLLANVMSAALKVSEGSNNVTNISNTNNVTQTNQLSDKADVVQAFRQFLKLPD